MNATCSILETVKIEGIRKFERKLVFYNLDMIISVGHRLNTNKDTQFKISA